MLRTFHETSSIAGSVPRGRNWRGRKLDALLVFAQESHYYLTGFDTGGYKHFQCVVLTTEERPIVLLTRRPDLQQARRTSTIEDIRIWHDAEEAQSGARPQGHPGRGGASGAGRLGVDRAPTGSRREVERREYPRRGGAVNSRDTSSVVQRLRVVKSDAELVYVRKSATLADLAVRTMLEHAHPRNAREPRRRGHQ